MFTRDHSLIQVSFFPTLLCALCIVGCFLPWLEYRTTWYPSKVISWGEFATNPVYERLRLLSLGPDSFGKPADSPINGCYVRGMCGTCDTSELPNRLHISKLTDPQRSRIRRIRILGTLASILSLVMGGLSFVELVIYSWHKFGARFTMVSLGVVVGVVPFILLALIGPAVNAIFDPSSLSE